MFNKFNSVIDYFSNCLIFIQHDFFTNYYDIEYKKISDEFNSINKFISKESNFLQSKSELKKLLEKQEVFVLFNYLIQDSEYYIFSEDEIFSKNKIANIKLISKNCKRKKKLSFVLKV